MSLSIGILKQLAIMQEENEPFFICEDIAYKGDKEDNKFEDWEEVGEYNEYDNDYKVYTDNEADTAWEESLDNYIDECILSEIPKHYHIYFDDEKWKRDAKIDGRGHSLASYDGNEREQVVQGETFYLYKQ